MLNPFARSSAPAPATPAASPSGGQMYPGVGGGAKDIGAVLREVEQGLPNEVGRLDEARKNNDFYEADNLDKYVVYRDAEQVYDHQFRPKRYSTLCRAAIEYLCMHLYAVGPQRRLTKASAAADRWLQEVYAANHVDALFQQADELATLNRVAAFQVAALGGPGDGSPAEADAGEPDPGPGFDLGAESPIKIHLLGADEFTVWTEPGDPLKPWAVCTISRYNERTRYQVWTSDHYYTLYGRALDPSRSSGARKADLNPDESGPNPYGMLPFSFVPAKQPTRDFWVPAPGTALRKANHYIINQLSELADSIRYYTRPMGYAINVRDNWRPLIRPGSFTHVPSRQTAGAQNFEPKVGYLESNLNIEGILKDLDSYVDRVLEEHSVPPAVFRLDVGSNVSGVSILLRHAPLISRAKCRQRPFGRYEADLARVVLAVGGAYYQRQDLWDAAFNGRLQLTWPEPEIPVPGPDKDTSDQWELENGLASKVMVLMRRRGLTREQAIEELKQIAEDNQELERLGLAPAMGEAPVVDEEPPAEPDDAKATEEEDDEPEAKTKAKAGQGDGQDDDEEDNPKGTGDES